MSVEAGFDVFMSCLKTAIYPPPLPGLTLSSTPQLIKSVLLYNVIKPAGLQVIYLNSATTIKKDQV